MLNKAFNRKSLMAGGMVAMAVATRIAVSLIAPSSALAGPLCNCSQSDQSSCNTKAGCLGGQQTSCNVPCSGGSPSCGNQCS